MTVTDFKIYLATREELVRQGILKAPLTTQPTTTLTPPTLPAMPEFEWNFKNIHSNFIMSSYLNLSIHGLPKGDNSGLTFSKSTQYLEIPNIGKTCLTDIRHCRNGLTIVLEILFNHLEENTIILTTGGETPDLPGLSVVYRYGHFHFICSSTTQAWFVSIPRQHIKTGINHELYITWKDTLKVYVDRILMATAQEHITHPETTHELKGTFYFGKPFTSVTTAKPVQCVLKNLHIWYQGIDELVKSGELLVDEIVTTPVPLPVTPKPGQCPVGCVPETTSTESTTTTTTKAPEPKTHPQTTPAPSTQAPTTSTPVPRTHAPTTSTPSTTTVREGKPDFGVSVTMTPVVDASGTYLACRLDTFTLKDVLIQFHWYIDNVEQITKSVTTPLTEGRLYVSEIKGVSENLYQKEIYCTAKAKYVGGQEWTDSRRSSSFKPEIHTVTPTRSAITLTEGHNPGHIELKPNCPPQLLCKISDKGQCKAEIVATLQTSRYDRRCTREKILPQAVVHSVGKTESAAVCGQEMTQSNWKDNVKLAVKATVDGIHDRDQHRTLLVQLKTTGTASKETFTTTAHTYQMVVKDRDNFRTSTCASLNDPHISTFDGLHYNNYQRGEFILYKHKTLPYEIHTRYETCSSRNPRGPTCNCGVAIKSGDDVITVNGCHGGNGRQSIFGRFFHHSRTPPMTVELYKNGELTPGTTIRRIGCGQKYEIRLPTGTLITVQSSYQSFINIWVKASAVDHQQTLGLCGSFNGNKHDDLFGKDHRTYHVEKQPDHFSQTWKSEKTIFHGVAVDQTASVNFCSCVQGEQLYCAPSLDIFHCTTTTSRDDITATLVRQAKVPILTPVHRRTKRAVAAEDVDVVEDDTIKNYTESAARTECEDYISTKAATKKCAEYVNVTEDMISECAEDLVETGEHQWAESHLNDIITKCISEARRNVNWEDNSTSIEDSFPEDIAITLCTSPCEHGNCSEGSCVCADGYTGPTCSVNKKTVPEILPVPMDGQGCDLSDSTSCSDVAIMGFNFVDSDTLTCFYQYMDVTTHIKINGPWIPTSATYMSTYQVVCALPEPHNARVAVSNDGITPSDNKYLHVVHDNCHICEVNEDGTDASCSRKEGTCVIDAKCYKSGDKKYDDKCAPICDTKEANNSWTSNSDPMCTATKLASTGEEESVSSLTIALAVVIGVLGVIILVAGGVYCLRRSPQVKRKLVEEGEYDFTSPQSRLSAMPRPNMRDISFSNNAYDGTAESLKTLETTGSD